MDDPVFEERSRTWAARHDISSIAECPYPLARKVTIGGTVVDLGDSFSGSSSSAGGYDAPGGYNDAGCPRDQWVDGYYRKDGTYVRGYYRNSPTDGCGGG